MISKECFTQEWVETVSQQLHYPDKNLIEKVIRAFALVDMLGSSGCDFCCLRSRSLLEKDVKNLIMKKISRRLRNVSTSRERYRLLLSWRVGRRRGSRDQYIASASPTPSSKLPAAVNKLAIANPEAFFYWAKVFEILKDNGE